MECRDEEEGGRRGGGGVTNMEGGALFSPLLLGHF